jgi:predicted small lipoprotein YifL
MTARGLAAGAVVAALLAGCGYKGPLTLPEKPGPVVIRPAPTAQPTGTQSPAAQSVPAQTPTTKPEDAPPATPPPPATEGSPPSG